MERATVYSHLLVPIDDSVLSTANCEAAVRLAKALNARITFFHAVPSLGAMRPGATLRTTLPGSFAESAFGDACSLLAAHAVAAEEAGVSYDVESSAVDEPAAAIVAAAQASRCDLIVMATHGPRGVAGLLHGSHTQRVLRRTSIPVLVTRVEPNAPVGARERVLAVLHQEHHLMMAVVHGLRDMMKRVATSPASLDALLLESMLEYLRDIQALTHDPKEEHLLLDALCERSPSSEALRADVRVRHEQAAELTRAALAALEPVMSDQGAALGDAVDRVVALADKIEQCIALEEAELVPSACRLMLDEDWARIAPEFVSSREVDPVDARLIKSRQMFAQLAGLRTGVAENVTTGPQR